MNRENAVVRLAPINRLARIVVVLAGLSAGAPAYAIGYWNVPGNVAQWWGYGWGAGHHACYVLGPVSHEGAFDRNQVRLRHSLQPPCGYCGCTSSNGYDFRQSTQFAPAGYQPSPQLAEPTPAPATAPETLPMPEVNSPPGAIFPAPVEP